MIAVGARRRPAYKTLIFAIAVMSAGLAAVVVATGPSDATPVAEARPFSMIDPARKGLVRSAAKIDHIDTESIYEVAAFGSGPARASALVGLSPPGEQVVALSQGFAIERFEPIHARFEGRPMIVSVGTQGPSDDVRQVGVVGGVQPVVKRVTIERNDGTTIDAELVWAPVGGARFFSFMGNTNETFPKTVVGYDRAGHAVVRFDVASGTLCSGDRTTCAD